MADDATSFEDTSELQMAKSPVEQQSSAPKIKPQPKQVVQAPDQAAPQQQAQPTPDSSNTPAWDDTKDVAPPAPSWDETQDVKQQDNQQKQPDTSAMKSYVENNLESYKQSQASKAQPEIPNNKTYAQNFGDALVAGLQMSSAGLLTHGMPTTVLPEHAGRALRIVSQVGQYIGDAPAMVLGGVIGSATAGPGAGTLAGAFAAPQGLRKLLMDHYEKGDIKNASDFVDRLMGAAWESTKGAVTGVATSLAGPAVGAAGEFIGGTAGAVLASTTAATGAELAAMTTVGAGLEGRLPTSEEFIDGAILLGGIHGVSHIAPKLRNIYAATGDRPNDVMAAADKDVQLKQDLLSPDPNVPEIAKPTDLKQTDQSTSESGAVQPPKTELAPKEEPQPQVPESKFERTPEEKEILSKIGINPEQTGETLSQKFDNAYARNIDYLDPIKSALEEAKQNGAEISPQEDPYQMGRRFSAHMDTIRSFLDFGTRDGKTNEINGEGLNAIYKDIPDGDLDGYRAYGIAKRSLELEQRGVTPYEGFDKDVAQKVVNQGAEKYEQINQRRVDFQNRVLDFAKEKGLFTDEGLDSMKDLNKDHFPFNRVQDADFYTGKVKSGSALKNIYGSDRAILDPILQTYKNTEMIVKKAMINDVRNSFVDAMREGKLLDEGNGEPNENAYLTKVSKDLIPIEISGDEISRGLKKQGIEGVDSQSISVFRPEKSYLKDNQIAIWEDGKPVVYEGPPGVIDSLKRMDGDFTSIDTWSKIMRAFATTTRVGVIANPGFGVSHFFRSQIMASVYSKTGMIPFFDSAMALKELMGKSSQDYQDWVYHGGASSSWLRIEDNYLKDNNIERDEKEAPTHGKAWNAVHSAMEATEAFIKLTDNASRFAEYKKSVAQGVSPEEAAFRSREVIPDYQKVGLERSALRTGVAFIGAHINSLDRMVQAFSEDPKSTIAKLSVISAVSGMLWLANKDDPAIDAIPNWQKDQYWNFNVSRMIGGSGPDTPATPLRLPKPWAPGILFGSGVEVALDSFFKDKPYRIKDFENTLLGSVVPEPIPNIAQPILEQWANKNKFTGRALVNQSLEKELPEMQYEPYTSESAKQIAKLIGYVPLVKDIGPKGQNVTLASPIVVENYIRAWGGTVGSWALKIGDTLINQEKKNQIDKSNLSEYEKEQQTQKLSVDKADPWQNTAVLRSFVSRYPSFNDQNVQDFYRNKDEADKVLNSIHAAAKRGDPDAAQRIYDSHPELGFRLDGISTAISQAKKSYSQIQSDTTMPTVHKRQLLDTVLFQIGAMAKQGNQMISDFKKQSRGSINKGE